MNFENVKFNCIKGIPINSVETRMISEMGFPVDVPSQPDMSLNTKFSSYIGKIFDSPFSMVRTVETFYINTLLETKSRNAAFDKTLLEIASANVSADELTAGLQSSCIYELEASDAEILVEEFIFIINTLLPRQLSDIYYSFDIEPNPAYALFFEMAAEKLELQRYDDQQYPWYGQFINHTDNGVKKRIENGESLISIYRNTCATKDIIKNVFYNTPHNTFGSIEAVLFSLSKQYYYEKNDSYEEDACDFFVYKDGEKILNIMFLCEDELDHIEDYDKYIAELYTVGKPLLVLDEYETYIDYLSKAIRKAVKDPAYIAEHAKMRSKCFKFERAFKNSDDNHKFANNAKLCGCFSCGDVFEPREITEWYFYEDPEKGGYAHCPKCGEDTVIMDSQGYEITEDYMQELIDYIDERDSFEYY